MENISKEKNISRVEANKKLHELIDTRDRLQGHVSNLKQLWANEPRPHVKKSIVSLFILAQRALKSTNKRISLLDTAIERGDVV